MKSDYSSSHSRYPAKRHHSTNPDDTRDARKITEPYHINQPQMQQGGAKEAPQQQGDGDFVRDQNVGGFG